MKRPMVGLLALGAVLVAVVMATLAREERRSTGDSVAHALSAAEENAELEPSMTLAQLARRLRLDKGWTSRAVDQLVEQGLVRKVAGDGDRRTIAISLTRAGRAEHRRLEAILNEQVTRVIGRVPSAQRTAVERALALLHQAYVEELASDAGAASRSACEVPA